MHEGDSDGAQATSRTTIYYDPQGVPEAAYVQFRPGKPLKKVQPDPRYLVSVYLGG